MRWIIVTMARDAARRRRRGERIEERLGPREARPSFRRWF